MTPMDERRLPAIEGSRNFRDLGGYRTMDGRSVRWGRIYRSGSLGGLTDAGAAQLGALGIRALCDLRTTRERDHEPYAWCEGTDIAYWARDYATSFADLRTALTGPHASDAATRAAMIGGYRHLPYEQAPAYARIFRWLADGEVPAVFNCSAGKDRAGTAAALILAALGVPRETVLADYAMTDTVIDLRSLIAGGGMLSRHPPEIVDAILRTDPEYIAAAFDGIDTVSGSLDAYLRETIGLSADEITAMRDALLE